MLAGVKVPNSTPQWCIDKQDFRHRQGQLCESEIGLKSQVSCLQLDCRMYVSARLRMLWRHRQRTLAGPGTERLVPDH